MPSSLLQNSMASNEDKTAAATRVEEVKGKGKVLLSTKDVAPGEELYQDAPVLVYKPPSEAERIKQVDEICAKHKVGPRHCHALQPLHCVC